VCKETQLIRAFGLTNKNQVINVDRTVMCKEKLRSGEMKNTVDTLCEWEGQLCHRSVVRQYQDLSLTSLTSKDGIIR
jgi:hypothetical protein